LPEVTNASVVPSFPTTGKLGNLGFNVSADLNALVFADS
jgi:hypothetical protein